MVKCVIVDDEQDAIDYLVGFLKNFSEITLVATFSNPVSAFEYFKRSNKIDLVFMDVDMPLLDGVALSGLIRVNVDKLVFTTSHASYALDAFKVDANDFLLKPYSFADLARTLQKLYPSKDLVASVENVVRKADFLFVKNKEDGLKLIKICFDDIVAIESLLNYIRIHTVVNKIVTHISLKEVKALLSDNVDFIQLHRSFIISTRHISVIDGNMLLMSTGAKFTIGDSYREVLNRFLAEKTLKPGIKKMPGNRLNDDFPLL